MWFAALQRAELLDRSLTGSAHGAGDERSARVIAGKSPSRSQAPRGSIPKTGAAEPRCATSIGEREDETTAVNRVDQRICLIPPSHGLGGLPSSC